MNNTEDIAMTVKEALELYFQKSKEFWMRVEKTYPRTAYIKDYVCWPEFKHFEF